MSNKLQCLYFWHQQATVVDFTFVVWMVVGHQGRRGSVINVVCSCCGSGDGNSVSDVCSRCVVIGYGGGNGRSSTGSDSNGISGDCNCCGDWLWL